MKKVLNVSSAIIVAICSFGIIINILHYSEIRNSHTINFQYHYDELVADINNIENILNEVNIDDYDGELSEDFLREAKSNLDSCLESVKTLEMLNYRETQTINIKDIEKLIYDMDYEKSCRGEFRWFYTLEDKEEYTELERQQFKGIDNYFEHIMLLNLIVGIKLEEDIFQTNSYYSTMPFGFVEHLGVPARGFNQIYVNYLNIRWSNNVTITILEDLSNWLLEQMGGELDE